MPASILSADQFRGRRAVPTMDRDDAEELVIAAQAAIEAEVGPLVSTEQTLEYAGTWSHRLRVYRTPLTAVSAASIDGTTVDTSTLTLLSAGVLIRPQGRHWGGPDVPVSVTLTSGFASSSVPRWLVELVVAIARRVAANPDGVTQETLLSYSVTHSSASLHVRLTANERAYVRRRFGLGVGHF